MNREVLCVFAYLRQAIPIGAEWITESSSMNQITFNLMACYVARTTMTRSFDFYLFIHLFF